MEPYEIRLIQSFVGRDEELKKLWEEHRSYEDRLRSLQTKGRLSDEEEMEVKRIQKLKLAGKDRILKILERHRKAGSAAV